MSEQTQPSLKDRSNAVVRLVLNVDTVNVMGEARNAAGELIEMPATIDFAPQFYSAAASIKLAAVHVLGREAAIEPHRDISCGSLNLSGSDGRVRVLASSSAVTPKFLGGGKPPKPADPPEKPPEKPPEPETSSVLAEPERPVQHERRNRPQG